MRGWFDLFRENGGPTLYAYSNRTPVVGDVTTITLCTVFATLYIAFFIVFPGIRRERFTTFLSVTLSLFVGTAILLGNNGSGWHTSQEVIASAYKAFSNEKIMGRLGVYVGLDHVNVTLDAMPIYYNNSMDVHFNERLRFDGPTQLEDEYRAALVKGLPFPILTVAEYMSVDAEGFCWGRNYRVAGYYTSIFLWASFVLWISMNFLLVIVPRYGAYAMTSTGAMMLCSNLIYFWLLPDKPLVIRVEDAILTFELGWCFWLILVAGALCLMVGVSISIIDLMYPHKFSTILEMDYGTPFDRHTIIEDSHETKKKKRTLPKLEEPATVGFGGLLRRLSKRDHSRGSNNNPDGGSGHDNYAFEMEAPKSPWRYPHLMFRDNSRKHKSVSFKASGGNGRRSNQLELPPGAIAPNINYLRRTDSKDSDCSSINSMQPREDLRPTISVPPFHDRFHKQFRRTDSSESSNSSLASFGGLFRKNSRKNRAEARAAALAHHQQQQQQHMHSISIGGQHTPVERADSGQSVISRGYTVQQGDPPVTSTSSAAGVVTVSTGGGNNGANNASSEGASGKNDEVTIIVSSGRKNSTTKAVRRNSAEHQRSEAAMW